jgi:hypothetical protein
VADDGEYPTPPDWDIAEGVIGFVTTKSDAHHWAYEYLTALASADPVRALHIVEIVLDAVIEPDQIGLIGAGPLEDIATAIGERLAADDRIAFETLKDSARDHPRVREALVVAWPHPADPPELWDGLDEILGTRVHERHRPGTASS